MGFTYNIQVRNGEVNDRFSKSENKLWKQMLFSLPTTWPIVYNNAVPVILSKISYFMISSGKYTHLKNISPGQRLEPLPCPSGAGEAAVTFGTSFPSRCGSSCYIALASGGCFAMLLILTWWWEDQLDWGTRVKVLNLFFPSNTVCLCLQLSKGVSEACTTIWCSYGYQVMIGMSGVLSA